MTNSLIRAKRFISQKFAGYFLEITNYLSYFYRNLFLGVNKPKIKFVIFCHGRSGSTLLLDLLNSHPQVSCDGEILSRKVFSPSALIKCRSLMSNKEVYGFKLLSYQIRDVQKMVNPRSFMKAIHNKVYKVIFLRRSNLLRLVLSVLYAEFRNEWHHKITDGEVSHLKMKVDVENMLKMLKESEETYRFESEIMKEIPHFSLIYEEDLENRNTHDATLNKITDYLKIANSVSSTPDVVKITPKRLEDFVENLAEVENALIENSYEEYLEEPALMV